MEKLQRYEPRISYYGHDGSRLEHDDDEDGRYVLFIDADDEINRLACKLVVEEARVTLLQIKVRRLRAMVLRGYARAFRNTASCACDPPEDKAPYDETMRAARLFEHWAKAIEAGRV